MIRGFCVFILLLTATFEAQAANVATSDVTTVVQPKPWNMLLDMNHQPAARRDQFAVTDFTMFLDYRVNPKHLLRILQAPTKLYETGGTRGENEWQASDTILSHFWTLPWTIEKTGTRFRLVNVVNIPTSIESQDNSKILTFGQTLQLNTMIGGKFLVSLRPFYRYNWYQFNVSPGGFNLPLLTYGVSMVNSYNVTDNLSLNASFSASVVNESASQFDTSTNLGGWVEENPGGFYSMFFSVNYSWTEKFGTYVGYSQGDNYIRDGRFEFYSYDPNTTRYSIGTTFYF